MKTYYTTILLVLLLNFFSCKKFVDINPPTDKLVTATVFQTDATATAALLNVYSNMVTTDGNPYNVSLFNGLSADELKTYTSMVNYRQMYLNAMSPKDAATNQLWTSAYNFIYQANGVIEGCQASNSLSPEVKQRLIGEAKFVRGFWHFYLVNSFGGVPLVLSTDYSVNAKLERSPTSQVYSQIVSDLQSAIENLTDSYAGTDNNTSDIRIRPNKTTAIALLARVYLYTKNYTECEKQATKVIENNSLYHLEALDEVFLNKSQEAIWQLMTPSSLTVNTLEGAYYILVNKPAINATNSSTISASLLADFEPDDLRKSHWIGTYTDAKEMPAKTYLFPFKYKISTGSTGQEHSVVFRLAEQYLIRAEARAMNGNLSGAVSDLDVLRKRAAIPLLQDTQPQINLNDLIKAIMHERRVELFTEWGHRWFDLKRSGNLDEVMANESTIKGGSWKSTARLYPIPQNELFNNPNLIQNPGYN